MSTRILVARLDSMGDVLLCGPAIRAVASRPDAEVWMLCSSIGAPAARLLPGVDRVLDWDCPWITASAPEATPGNLDRLHDLLLACAPDEAVVLTSFHQSPLPLALELRRAGVPRISGASVDFAGSLLDVRLRPGEDLDEDQPEPERALAIVAAAGFSLPQDDDGRLRMCSASTRPDALAGVDDYVVIHPGASASSRRWPAERHADLVRALAVEGVAAAVTGSDDERGLAAFVAGTNGIDLSGNRPLDEVAAIIAGASVLVSGNTGPAHIATAVGTPVVSLFSPVVPAVRWAPYRVPTVLLGDQTAACAGTRARDCPVPGHPCLRSVSVDEVAAGVRALAPGLFRDGADGVARAEGRSASGGLEAVR